ncbi:MAG: hypothetical protein AAF581_22225, partial [Planctomycetota bacterium]
MASSQQGRTWNPLLGIFGLVLAQLLLIAGCDTGSRGGPAGPPPVIPPAVDVGTLMPDEGHAGTVMTINGHGFNLDPTLNEVLFVQNGGDAVVAGQILSVADTGVDEFGRTITAMAVRVPTNVRNSSVQVRSFDGTDFVFAGSKDFLGGPVVTAVVYGAANAGFGTLDVTGSTVADLNVVLYGFNLGTPIGALATDENSQPVTVTVAPGAPAGAPAPAPGMTTATVTFAAGTTIPIPNCVESGTVELELQTAGNGAVPLVSNKVIVKFRKSFASGDLDDLHGSVTSLLIPSGVRAGKIEVYYNIHAKADGTSARFDVTPQYLDASGTYADCTIVGGPIEDVLSGGSAQPSNVAALPTVGHPACFVWDSATDLPGFDGVTELRIQIDPATNSTFFCDQLDAEIFSAPIALGNGSAMGGGVPVMGSVAETFLTEHRLDTADTGVWVLGAGELVGTGHPMTTPSVFGSGTKDVVLEDGIAYTIDTDSGVIIVDDITLGLPTPLTDAENPGALVNELHVRTFTMAPTAIVSVVGANPIVIRASGTGTAGDTVVKIDGDIDLSGTDGTAGNEGTPGVGGIGIAGGGAGGDGALGEAGTLDVQNIIPATDGEGPGGGQAGVSTSWLSQSIATGRGGPGGGAGHATAGLDGTNNDPSNAIAKAQPGRGGPAYGDSRLVHLTPGSGGGGGGTGVRYVPSSQTLSDKSGGGGGAGGGAIEIVADGVVDVTGSIRCDGGRGGSGAAGPYGGQGGPGSGGAIAIR